MNDDLIFNSRECPGSVVVYDPKVSATRALGMICKLRKDYPGATHRYIPISGPSGPHHEGNSYQEVKAIVIKELRP